MILAKTVLNRHSLNGKRQDREKNCSLSTISSIAKENSEFSIENTENTSTLSLVNRKDIKHKTLLPYFTKKLIILKIKLFRYVKPY